MTTVLKLTDNHYSAVKKGLSFGQLSDINYKPVKKKQILLHLNQLRNIKKAQDATPETRESFFFCVS